MRRGIVIPTYNEYNNIGRIIPEIFKVDPSLQLIVVDDNSPDGTGDRVRELCRTYPDQIQLITQQNKGGLGAAYVTGITAAFNEGWDFICEMDADLSHQPKYLPELFLWAETYDLVMGSRYIAGGGVENWSTYRRFLSLFGNLYARTILGVDIRDLTSGFRCYCRRVIEAIDLKSVRSNGYAFQIETAYRTLANGFRIKEIPIVFVEREVGISKISNDIIKEAVTMVWKLRFNRRRLIAPKKAPALAPAAVQLPAETVEPAATAKPRAPREPVSLEPIHKP